MLPFMSMLGWFCVSWDFLLYLALKAKVPISTRSAAGGKLLYFDLDLEHWPWPLTLITKQGQGQQNVTFKHDLMLFDLDLWPTTLTYNPSFAINHHAKNQGQGSNGSNRRASASKLTDRRYQMYYLPCFTVNNKVSKPLPLDFPPGLRIQTFLYPSSKLCGLCFFALFRRSLHWSTMIGLTGVTSQSLLKHTRNHFYTSPSWLSNWSKKPYGCLFLCCAIFL